MNEEQARERGTATNPTIGGMLGTSDCSQVTDGAAFVALSSEKIIIEFDKVKKDVLL